MKRDSDTGRYMTTGRDLVSRSGNSFERVSSKGGEIVVVNTTLARKALAGGRKPSAGERRREAYAARPEHDPEG